MKKTIISIIFFVVTLPIVAQTASFVNLSPDTRAMGLAGASLAIDAQAFALYNNPAAMALSENKLAAGASFGMWQPDASDNTLIGASGFGKIGKNLGIGLAGRYFTHQPYNISSSQGALTGSYTPKEYAVDMGAAYRITEGLSLGVNARFIQSTIAESYQDNAFAADIALMYQIKNFSLAAAVTNLGNKMNFGYDDYPLPSLIKAGAAYNLRIAEMHRVSFSVEGDYHLTGDKGIMGGIGVEYAFKNIAFVRAGYHLGDELKVIPSYASVGLGIQFLGISLNAAYLLAQKDSPLANSLSVGLGWAF